VDQGEKRIQWHKDGLNATNQELAQCRASLLRLKDNDTQKAEEIHSLKIELEDCKIGLRIYENSEMASDKRENRLVTKTLEDLAAIEQNLGKIHMLSKMLFN
jgi:hypothetical protein